MANPVNSLGKESEIVQDIRERVLAHPLIADWDDLRWLVGRPTRGGRATWDLSIDACLALGGDARAAWPASAVIFCLLYSVHLVDDILDDDPEGVYHEIGVGAASNAALGLQSVASRILADLELEPAAECHAHRRLGDICLGTAYGQMLDTRDLPGEEAYWRVVDFKTPPLFSYALLLGGLVAGAEIERAEQVAELGMILGRMIQMSDDLRDALARPAAPDWKRQATNLAILYAETAEHEERERFIELKAAIDAPEPLEQAQEILVRSGAFSFCAYQLIQANRQARREIEALELDDPAALVAVFDHYMRPLRKLLESVGVEAPEAFFEAEDG